MIRFYNTLTRTKEPFIPIRKGNASVYTCGPTVYWYAHIGNMRSYIFADVLVRTLKFNGLRVKFVMNITDVGHLASDSDEGEDKMLVAMRREGKTAFDIAEFYTQAFMEDLQRLNITRADVYPKATEHIQQQIVMITVLEQKGFTYRTLDGMYFDTSKLKSYGQLSGQKAEEKQAGARVEMGGKKNITDFALWKFSPEKSHREMEWKSPWGTGFPGWHIECSAMSSEYLGTPFDIHTGGVDHIPVHHENELAQTQGAKGVLEANTWMHNAFLTVNDNKMSKSLGNLYTVSDLMEKGYDPVAYRYFVLGAHYRTKLNFSFEALDSAQHALEKIRQRVIDWDKPGSGCQEYEDRFREAMNDDLNTPKALAVLWDMLDANVPTSDKAYTLLKMDEVLGLGLLDYVSKPLEVPALVLALVHQREKARLGKDWEASDILRAQIEDCGYVVEDTQDGSKLKKK